MPPGVRSATTPGAEASAPHRLRLHDPEAFVSLFGRYCDGEVIFVATRQPRPTGEELSFTITLAGGEPLISATGRVEESYREGEGPLGRPGMVIRFRVLAPECRPLVNELAAVPGPEGGFARGTAPPGVSPPFAAEPDEGGDPDQTRPSGLPRSLAGRRASIDTVPGVGPRAPGLGVKPDATPAPILLQQRARTRSAPTPTFSRPRAPGEGRDEDMVTGVQRMDDVARSRVRYSPGDPSGDFEGGGWDPGTEEVFDPGARGARMALRADSAGRLDSESLGALAECDVHEDAGQVDGHGVPNSAPVPIMRPQDVWEGDETLPPWLRGPQPSDDLDVPTGSVDISALGADDDDPDYPAERPPAEPALSLPASLTDALAGVRPGTERPGHPSALPPLLDHAPREPTSPPFGTSPDLIREGASRELAARDLPRAPSGRFAAHEPMVPLDLRPRRRWPIALLGALLGCILGLAVGYAMGAEGVLDELLDPDAAGAAAAPAPVTPSAQPAAAASPAATATAPAIQDAEGAVEREASAAAVPTATAGTEAAGMPAGTAAGAEPPDEGAEEMTAVGRVARLARGRALGADKCGAAIDSDPSNSDLSVGGKSLGSTPARLEMPCGTVDVEARRSRYQTATRRLRLRPGKLEQVELHLDRPDYKLRIVSAPLGAAVTVNGRSAGVTPTTANVKGYQQIKVRVEHQGFESWSRKVYAREPLTKLTVKLSPDKDGPAPGATLAAPAAPPPTEPR